jgi:hypothetical protein
VSEAKARLMALIDRQHPAWDALTIAQFGPPTVRATIINAVEAALKEAYEQGYRAGRADQKLNDKIRT